MLHHNMHLLILFYFLKRKIGEEEK